MPSQVMPYLVEAGGELLRFAIREWSNRRVNTVEAPSYRVLPPTPAPAREGCPYCHIARCLSASHLYIWRAADRERLFPVYLELARQQLEDAAAVCSELDSDLQRAELEAELKAIEAQLVAPSTEQAKEAARGMWTCAMRALRMAEMKQVAPER